jgi:hypothetical protein
MRNVEKAKAQAIMDELGPIIKEAMERHGLATPQMQWKYGAWFELKLNATLLEEGPHGINLGSKEASYFKQFGFHGLDAPLGTVFTSRGDAYAFAGIASKRPKYPVYAKNLVQGTYHFFPEGIIPSINAAAEKAAV